MKRLFYILVTILFPLATASADTWDGASSDKGWYSENATEFFIESAAQLKGLADLVNTDEITFEGKMICLQNDIDLANEYWTPIGYGFASDRPFKGTFDGNGHKISNLHIDNSILNKYPSQFVGLFGQLNNGTIRNIEVQGVVDINKGFSSTAYIGGLVANASGTSVISGIRSNIVINFYQLGGIPYIGNVAGSAQDMSQIASEGELHFYNNTDIAQGYYGGVVGKSNNLSECSSDVRVVMPGIVAGQSYVGGIAGNANSISDAIFTGRFEVYDTNAASKTRVSGGICGSVGDLANIISAPSYYYCSTDNAAKKGIVVPPGNYTNADNVFYQDTYAQGTSVVGTGVTEDALKSGNALTGFNTSIWHFEQGKYPVLRFLVSDENGEEPQEYVDLGLPSGTLWATKNLNAEKPEDIGKYYAWGETQDKWSYDWYNYAFYDGSQYTKYCTAYKYGIPDGKTELDADDDAAVAVLGSSWRTPSSTQLNELVKNCSVSKLSRNGVEGCLFTGPNGNSIFLPNTGGCKVGSNYITNCEGYYWSRNLYPSDDGFAYMMTTNGGTAKVSFGDRYVGCVIRPVYLKDASGIASPTFGDSQYTNVYDINGRRLSHQRKGLNIIRDKDGKAKKVFVK